MCYGTSEVIWVAEICRNLDDRIKLAVLCSALIMDENTVGKKGSRTLAN